jgi:hypothetical protein
MDKVSALDKRAAQAEDMARELRASLERLLKFTEQDDDLNYADVRAQALEALARSEVK